MQSTTLWGIVAECVLLTIVGASTTFMVIAIVLV
jgi:hypothetical protein